MPRAGQKASSVGQPSQAMSSLHPLPRSWVLMPICQCHNAWSTDLFAWQGLAVRGSYLWRCSEMLFLPRGKS